MPALELKRLTDKSGAISSLRNLYLSFFVLRFWYSKWQTNLLSHSKKRSRYFDSLISPVDGYSTGFQALAVRPSSCSEPSRYFSSPPSNSIYSSANYV